MGSTIPQLKLFSIYPGSPQVANRSYLSANSSFYTQATSMTPAYGVNVQPTANPLNPNTYYSLNPQGLFVQPGQPRAAAVQQRPINQARVFSDNIGFNLSALGGLEKKAVPGVAPVIPGVYESLAKLYEITDANFNDLMAQPEFRIPNIGLGLKVTTDGAGGVQSIVVSPSSYGQLPAQSPLADTFGGPKRYEITTGATFKTRIDSGPGGTTGTGNTPGTNANNLQNLAQNLSNSQQLPQILNGLNALNGLNGKAGLSGLDAFQKLSGLNNGGLGGMNGLPASDNAILQRLAQLQPQEQGLALFGYEAAVNAQQARQVAASQAGFDVISSRSFKDNTANLASASRLSESYGKAFDPRQMDGRVNINPFMAQAPASGGPSGADGFNLGAQVSADAANRRGSGGYIPFQMQWSDQGAFGGMAQGSMSGGQNPFGSNFTGAQTSGQQSRQQRRRPLAFTA